MTMVQQLAPSVIVLDECDEPEAPSLEQVREYAEFIGIDTEEEPHLMWIAVEGVMAPVPPPWKMCTENGEDMFYFNFESGESVWDHPCDDKFRELLELCRMKDKDSGGVLGAGLLSPLGGRRFGTLPPIYEVSCSGCSDAEDSVEEERQVTTAESNGSSYEDSSDAEDLGAEEQRTASSIGDKVASELEQASEDECSSEEEAVERLLRASTKDEVLHSDTEDSEGNQGLKGDSLDPFIESEISVASASPRSSRLQGFAAAEGTPETSTMSKEVAAELDDIQGEAVSEEAAATTVAAELRDIQDDLRSILEVLGKLHETCGEQTENLHSLRASLVKVI